MTAPPRPAPPRPPMDARIRERRRAVLRQRARRRRRVTLTLAGLVLLAAALAGVARSPLFALEEVRVVGVDGDRAAAVRTVSGLLPGDNVLAADLAGVAERVGDLPWVRSADVARVPPAVVEVRVVERTPALVVRLADSSWLLDEERVVLQGGTAEGLPVVQAPDSVLPPVGAVASDAAVRAATEVWQALPGGLAARVRQLEAASPRGVRLQVEAPTGEAVWVRFGTAERVEDKARITDLLLEQALAQARRQADGAEPDTLGVDEIDVRAPDNPVLVPAGG